MAVQLTNLLAADPPCPPSERLLHVANLGLEREAEIKNKPLTNNEKVRLLFSIEEKALDSLCLLRSWARVWT